jgi:ligand-binding sensor domain-containing protein
VPALAQPVTLRVDRLTTADGLAQNMTHRIVQDTLGYYWIGSAKGLQRYDGHTLVDYPLPGWPSEALLKGRHITPRLIDPRGRLWLTMPENLFRLDLAAGEVVGFGRAHYLNNRPVQTT